jgi:hypothetical protein
MKSKFSTSSLESEDLASDSKEPDIFGPLLSANESRSAKPSSKRTGPTRQSTTMSEPSTQMDLEELTSSAADSHANRGVSPGSSEAQKMTETSGQKWLGLLKSYNLDGSLAKMCVDLLTSQWASSAAFLTWRASGIKPSHLLFQLAPSMPRTDETGSGLWPTPNAREKGGGEYQDPEKIKARMEKGHQSNLGDMVKLWPTVSASDWEGARTPEQLKRVGRTASNSLGDAVRATAPSGSLNPQWVEWLMGYEIGHTDLGHWEMPLSRKSSKKSEEQSLQVNNEPNKN